MSRMPTVRDLEDWGDECDAAFDAMSDEELAARRAANRAKVEAAEAKRNAAQTSPEILSLQEAFLEGQRAGMHGTAASLNPYDHGFPEYAEWERGRLAAMAARLGRAA